MTITIQLLRTLEKIEEELAEQSNKVASERKKYIDKHNNTLATYQTKLQSVESVMRDTETIAINNGLDVSASIIPENTLIRAISLADALATFEETSSIFHSKVAQFEQNVKGMVLNLEHAETERAGYKKKLWMSMSAMFISLIALYMMIIWLDFDGVITLVMTVLNFDSDIMGIIRMFVPAVIGLFSVALRRKQDGVWNNLMHIIYTLVGLWYLFVGLRIIISLSTLNLRLVLTPEILLPSSLHIVPASWIVFLSVKKFRSRFLN